MTVPVEPRAEAHSAPGPHLIPERPAAALLGVSPRTLQAWRTRGVGPPFVKVGNSVRYCPRTLAAYVRSNRMTKAPPKRPGPVTLPAQRTALPGRVVELLAAKMVQAHAGEPRLGSTLSRRLAQALAPHERELALALTPQGSVLADGRVRLLVTPHVSVSAEELGPHRHRVPVEYDPRTAQYHSPIAASLPGFDRLCAHVWRLQGNAEPLAARRLLALLGAAYLDFLAEGGER